MNIERFHSHQSESSMVNQLVGSASEKVSQAHSEYHVEKGHVLVNSHFPFFSRFRFISSNSKMPFVIQLLI